MVTVPTALPVTVPEASTSAIPVSDDEKVYLLVSFAPVAVTFVVLPTSMLVDSALTVKLWAAFVIVKSAEAVPS